MSPGLTWLAACVRGWWVAPEIQSSSSYSPALQFVVYLFGRTIYNLFLHPLSKYPGPRSVAATHFPYLRQLLNGDLTFWIHELHEKYGDVVRISPNELSYRTPESWKDNYGSRPGHILLPKDENFYRHPPGGVHSIITAPHKQHQLYRRLLAHAFSERALREQEPIMKTYVNLLIEQLHKRADGVSRLNMVDWYNWTTFDMIGDLSFGESFGCLEGARYHPWIDMLFNSIKMTVLAAASALIPMGEVLLALTVGVKGMKIRQTHMDLTVEKVSKRLEIKTDRNDFMKYILRETDDGRKMTTQEIMATCWHLIIAGSETTATLLSGVTYHLLRNPNALKALQGEVRNAFSTEEEINVKNVAGLKYMLACLDEAMRLYPPVSGGLPRSIPPGGETLGGEYIPEGVSMRRKCRLQFNAKM